MGAPATLVPLPHRHKSCGDANAFLLAEQTWVLEARSVEAEKRMTAEAADAEEGHRPAYRGQ